jgi:predicted RNA-binding protein Jag
MQDDPGITELLLKPQNSFLRRIQHQYIVDAGFRSESTGENADRAVKILR